MYANELLSAGHGQRWGSFFFFCMFVLMQRLSGLWRICVWPALPFIVPHPVLPHEVGVWVSCKSQRLAAVRRGCKAPDCTSFLSSPSYGEVAGSPNEDPSSSGGHGHVARGCMRRLRAACNGGGSSSLPRLPRRPGGRLMRNPAAHLRSSSPTQSNDYCSCTRPQPQGMDISELELVQIILILLAMSVMVAVVVCLLMHYRLVALSLLGRLGHAREVPTAEVRRDASGWPDGVLSQHGQGPSRTAPVLVQHHHHLCRLQPTYPYMPQETVNLPPMICLPSEEEKAPRYFRQHPELKRSCIRAPPNRNVLIDNYVHNVGPRVAKRESGSGGERSESPPPSYSVTIEDPYCKSTPPGPKRLQTHWSPTENTTSTEAVPHNSSVT
nr:low-density lipoprotein receptor class A domain-containing protein 4 [Syngnathus scovelli]